jgi:hypothetical protein
VKLRDFIGCMLLMAAISGALAVGLDTTAIYIAAGIVAALGIGILIASVGD